MKETQKHTHKVKPNANPTLLMCVHITVHTNHWSSQKTKCQLSSGTVNTKLTRRKHVKTMRLSAIVYRQQSTCSSMSLNNQTVPIKLRLIIQTIITGQTASTGLDGTC